MKQEATRAAAQEFWNRVATRSTPLVAGQAVLALVNPESNGLGADAVILVYHARRETGVLDQCRGNRTKAGDDPIGTTRTTAARFPNSDGLAFRVAARRYRCVGYLLLDRWGTMPFAQVLERSNRRRPKTASQLAMVWRVAIAGSKDPEISNLQEGVFSRPARPASRRHLSQRRFRSDVPEVAQAEQAAAGQGRHGRTLPIASIEVTSPKPWGSSPNRTVAFIGTRISRRITPLKHRCRRTIAATGFQNPSSSQGPAELFLLNILEGYNVKKLGHNSSEYIHAQMPEALKLALADREKLGDTDFVQIPYEGLLSKAYAARQSQKLIDPDHASLEIRPGNPEQFMKVAAAPAIRHTRGWERLFGRRHRLYRCG